jgi:uncharacterized protein YukE
MVAAVEEVNTVAEELRALRDKVKQYGDASKRLMDVGEILNNLNGSIGKIQNAFSGALERAEKAEGHINSLKQEVVSLATSVPDIVERIEAADVTKTIDGFTGEMRELKVLMDSHQKTMEQVISSFTEERSSHSSLLEDINSRTENIIASVSNLASEIKGIRDTSDQQFQKILSLSEVVTQDISPTVHVGTATLVELKGMVGEVQSENNKSVDVLADFAAKMLREISALRGEAVASKQLLEKQEQKLEEISKKKRSIFG